MSEATGSAMNEHLRARSKLRTIRTWCDEMARQEAQTTACHTVIAVDPDVIYMGAFPVENLALGSVFHDYTHLRNVAARVDAATLAGNHALRAATLMEIFESPSLRIPLLSTIALSAFIFDRRVRTEPLQAYALLQPHLHEWEQAQARARADAQRLHHALSKQVDVEQLRDIVRLARDEGHPVAEQLIDRLPETVSALFPAQLAPDYALGSTFRWKLAGVVKPYDKLEGLPRLVARPDAAARFMQVFEEDIRSSAATARLAEADRQRAFERLRPQIERDAQVMAMLQQVREEKPLVRLAGHETRPLRIILLTASARLWRVARKTGLATECLRNPIAYLGDGSFFDWAFEGSSLGVEEDQLLQRLRQGLLGQWLTPLTEAQSADDTVSEAHRQAVRQWERLMSNMATSLSLASPVGELRAAISQAVDQTREQDVPEQIAALLQHKIVDAANRLTQYASGAGLAAIAAVDSTLRNLPPVDLREYPAVHALLQQVAGDPISEESDRLDLLRRVMKLKVPHESAAAAERIAAYSRSILISLLWFRLQHWASANEVAGQAAAYALQKSHGEEAEGDATVEPEVRGEEALYLLAVTGRLCANAPKDLELPRMALDLIQAAPLSGERQLRTEAELQSFVVAEWLMNAREQPSSTQGALVQFRLQGLLGEAVALTMQPHWREAAQQVERAGADAADLGRRDYGAYMTRYALQQLHCAVGVLYLLALEAGLDMRASMPALAAVAHAFERTASPPLPPGRLAFGIMDSRVSQPIRQLMQWGLRLQAEQPDAEADERLAQLMQTLRQVAQAPASALSALDRLRLQRLLQIYDGLRPNSGVV